MVYVQDFGNYRLFNFDALRFDEENRMTSEKFSICSEIGIPEYIESARNAANQTCAFCTRAA